MYKQLQIRLKLMNFLVKKEAEMGAQVSHTKKKENDG